MDSTTCGIAPLMIFSWRGHFEANTLPSPEKINAMMELMYSPAGEEPPKRTLGERIVRRLFT
jgi:hypothetical protein